MSSIPLPIRKLIDSGRGEVRQLEREYHRWFVITFLSVTSCVFLVLSLPLLFTVEATNSLVFPRLLIGLTIIINIPVTYYVYRETLSRRQYLAEIQKLMLTGLSFLDAIRRGFQDRFKY
ncbi:MAG: hypothetical protein ACXABI_07340 [Candidatus Hodarchaeales archaeon]|jgi:hypothetical protein